jgi:hypothetical protein
MKLARFRRRMNQQFIKSLWAAESRRVSEWIIKSLWEKNRVRVRLGKIDFEKRQFLRINLRVGDEQFVWVKSILRRRRNLGKTISGWTLLSSEFFKVLFVFYLAKLKFVFLFYQKKKQTCFSKFQQKKRGIENILHQYKWKRFYL